MAEILVSMYPAYTKMILSRQKTTEFRRKIVNDLLKAGPHRLYLYETKKNGGRGKVVGQADVKQVFVTLYAEYIARNVPPKLCCVTVSRLEEIYSDWCKKTGKIPLDSGWFLDEDFARYRRSIGWTGDPGNYYNFALELENIQKYSIPLDVSEFKYVSGKAISRPPQNMCKCLKA